MLPSRVLSRGEFSERIGGNDSAHRQKWTTIDRNFTSRVVSGVSAGVERRGARATGLKSRRMISRQNSKVITQPDIVGAHNLRGRAPALACVGDVSGHICPRAAVLPFIPYPHPSSL